MANYFALYGKKNSLPYSSTFLFCNKYAIYGNPLTLNKIAFFVIFVNIENCPLMKHRVFYNGHLLTGQFHILTGYNFLWNTVICFRYLPRIFSRYFLSCFSVSIPSSCVLKVS